MFRGLGKAVLALLVALFLIPASAFASFDRPLSQGMSGSDVSALQQVLKDKGFFAEEITGYFGPVTKAALAAYQASAGLEAVGQAGPKTLALLNGEAVSVTPVSSSLLSTLITQLQQLLRNAGYYMVSLTGTLDQATLSAAQSISSGVPSAPVRSGGKPQHAAEEETTTPDTTAPVISSIASSTATTTATITWTTDEPATTVLNYGLSSSYGTASSSAGLSTSHTILLSGLTASTTYHFQVQSADAGGNVATSSDLVFATAQAPIWTVASLGSSLAEWWDAADTNSIQLNSNKVSSWTNKSGLDAAEQANDALRPTYASTTISSNGTSQYLAQPQDRGTATSSGAYTKPDVFGSDIGKGYTNTGLANATGTISYLASSTVQTASNVWFNGRHSSGGYLGNTHVDRPGIILEDSNFTLLAEYDLQDMLVYNGTSWVAYGTTTTSVQGVAWDPISNLVWFASTDTRELLAFDPATNHITKRFDFTSLGGSNYPNAVAYDSRTDQIVMGVQANGVLRWINKSTGAVESTQDISGSVSTVDQIFFSMPDNMLLVTGVNGSVYGIDLNTWTVRGRWAIAAATAAEGVVLKGTTLYLNNDAYFHNGSAFLNETLVFTVTMLPRGTLGTRFQLAWVGMPQTLGTTGALFAGNNGGVVNASESGVGVWTPSNAPGTIRLLITNGSVSTTVDWTGQSTSTLVGVVDVDLVAHTATLYVNGSAVSSQPINAAITNMTAQRFALGAVQRTASIVSYSKLRLNEFAAVTGSYDARIEGSLAWKWGLQGSLPLAHPYKSSAP